MCVINSYQQSDLVKLDILLNGQPVDAMATIVHTLKAQRVGRELVEKLKKFIDRSVYLALIVNFLFIFCSLLVSSAVTKYVLLLSRQMFEITIQAAIGVKIIARET